MEKNKVLVFLRKHLDFKFNVWAIISLLFIVASPFILKFSPIEFGYENGVLENIQMVILFFACFVALKTKNLDNKKFFTLVFLILIILILREVNCGRTLFFPVEGKVNTFYSWKEIPYGYLAHPIYGAYMGIVGIYFLVNKLWKNLFNILKDYQLPVFNILFLLIGMISGMFVEKAFHNDIVEEICELLFYFALVSIIYLYSFNKQKKID